MVRCRACGLMRTNPRPTIDSMAQYYPEEYEPYHLSALDEPDRWRRMGRWLDPLDVATPPLTPGDLLEIGSASGNYMLDMQRRGWRVTGVEFDANAAATAARRTGSVVRTGDLLTIRFAPESFDLVCGWMVFEHVHDPVRALAMCREWLRPGGWIALSVPDAGSWQFHLFGHAWFALQVPTHLYHFTRQTLRATLLSAGYDRISIKNQRTLFDVAMSLAYVAGDWSDASAAPAQRAARSLASRAVARAAGTLAGPLRWTGRITAWARRSG